LVLAAATGLSRPSFAQDAMMGETYQVDAFSYMQDDPDLTTWVQLITAGGLEQAARSVAPYTTFPATDQAFSAFPGIMKQLLGYQSTTGGAHTSMQAFPDTTKIVELVRSHVVRGKHYPKEVMGKKVTVESVAGSPVTVDATNTSDVTVSWTSAANGHALVAQVLGPPITCSNAVIYKINKIEDMG
jgi:uncharacterized surface protein with fasciclin (FAS1) repeats